MILEAIVTTRHEDGSPNVSPMGPEVNDRDNWNEFVLPDYFLDSTGIIILSSLLLFFVKNRLYKGSSVFAFAFYGHNLLLTPWLQNSL